MITIFSLEKQNTPFDNFHEFRQRWRLFEFQNTRNVHDFAVSMKMLWGFAGKSGFSFDRRTFGN